MLVIISDLHLTDGTSGQTISSGAFDIFYERLVDLAINASWRVDGKYRPIDRFEIVLLGDVLDVIRSSRWGTQNAVRPWTSPQQPEFVNIVTQITGDILRQNDRAFQMLRAVGHGQAITIPPATAAGKPAYGVPRQPVAVGIHYLVGNHDWFFHLPGPAYHPLRQSVARSMGLANRPDQPFAHDPNESDEILDVMRRHKVFARHGDLYDPFNFEGHRDASSLGDAIVIELLNRFAAAVENELASDLPQATLFGLRELDNVRPLLLVPVWIDGLLERTCPFASQRQQVKRVWDGLADRFLSLPFVRQRDTWSPNDLVDGLQNMLKFSKHISIGWASSILNWINGLRGSGEASYARSALAEQDFRNRRAKHVVYGHTHHPESVPLDASYAEGYVLNQTYFNSGTWRRVHRPTALAPNEHEFIASDSMTYLAFYQGDERCGRPYETWTGTLGLAPSDLPTLRIDPAQPPQGMHASAQSVSAPGVRPHAPHFALSPAATSAATAAG
ncbi:MAG: hypothetical protein JNG90_00500 [Planctomycetaceae bacterium]|nr:hypothetical protein [Planctomycetaceae bacterium]